MQQRSSIADDERAAPGEPRLVASDVSAAGFNLQPLGWGTLWGEHVHERRSAGALTGVSLSLTCLLLLGLFLGLGPGCGSAAPAPCWLWHTLMEWTGAVALLLIAGFALARYRSGATGEAGLLAVALPVVAVLDGATALAMAPAGGGEVALPALLATWTLGRLWLAVTYSLSAWKLARPLAGRRERWSRRAAALLAVLAMAIVALKPAALKPGLLLPDLVLPRLWELPPLALFLLGGLLVLPSLNRIQGSFLSYVLMVSLIPQVAAQVVAALSASPFDLLAFYAEGFKLLGYLVLFAGLVLDYVQQRTYGHQVWKALEAAQDELLERDRTMHSVGSELAENLRQKARVEVQLLILQKAVETMSVGVTITDLDGRIFYANRADARLHGYTVEELLGQSASIYAAPQSAGNRESPDPDILRWQRETFNVTRDGRVFPVRLLSDVVRGIDGKPLGKVTVCEDISQELEARRSLELRDRILALVSLAAQRFLAGRTWEDEVEAVLEELAAATRMELVALLCLVPGAAEPWREAGADGRIQVPELTPEQAEQVSELLTDPSTPVAWRPVDELPAELRQLLDPQAIRSVLLLPVQVGEQLWGALTLGTSGAGAKWSASVSGALSAAARILGEAVKRQRAEAELSASEARYRTLIEGASDLIQSTTPDGRLLFVNSAWRQVLGYEADVVQELSVWSVVEPSHRPRFELAVHRLADGGPPERLEAVFLTRGGRPIEVEGSLSRGMLPQEPLAILGIFRDITERRAVERLKQEFLSTVSHELRTPLTALLASLNLVASGAVAGSPEQIQQLLTIAERNGERLLKLINDLLDLRKIDAGQVHLRLRPTQLDEEIDTLLDELSSLAAERQIELRREPAETGIELLTDRDRLSQVLLNLLSNAIKFSRSPSTVRLVAGGSEERAWIRIEDQGPGIPEEIRHRLFERFVQGGGDGRRATGSGLGLAISKGLVEALGGKIQLASSPERGTRVTIELPLAGPAQSR